MQYLPAKEVKKTLKYINIFDGNLETIQDNCVN